MPSSAAVYTPLQTFIAVHMDTDKVVNVSLNYRHIGLIIGKCWSNHIKVYNRRGTL